MLKDVLNFIADWVLPGFFFMAILWTIGVIIRELLMKKNLVEASVDGMTAKRRAMGMSELSTNEENNEAMKRLRYAESYIDEDVCGFLHRADLVTAYNQVRKCQKIMPTDKVVVDKMNDMSTLIKEELRRIYLLWASGKKGQTIMVGAIIAAILAYLFTPFGPLFWLPLGLYLLFGRTPISVARNVGILEQWLSGSVFASWIGVGAEAVHIMDTNEITKKQ